VIGSHLYLIGGGDGVAPLGSIEHATLSSDNTLSTFTIERSVALATPRLVHSSVVVGSYLYVLGGEPGNNGFLDSVERAPIGADGTLGSFAVVSNVTLATPRREFGAAVIGDYVYVIGGIGQSGFLNSVERAPINGDGSLGDFSAVSGVTLVSARMGGTTAVTGDRLYVIGGVNGPAQLMTSVEQATINADGSLGTFSMAPVSLSRPRGLMTNAVVGKYLYVFGGDASTDLQTVERAPINADGSLGTFKLAN
jgi:hypothetical protein